MLKKISLEAQIKRVIGTRILACIFLLVIIISGMTVYDVSSTLEQLRSRINDQMKPLEDFVISQVMIDNVQAADVKLDNVNNAHLGYQVTWNPYGNPEYTSIRWHVPFSFVYDYKLGEISGYQFGSFRISGSFLSDSTLVYNLIILLILFLAFIIAILSFLLPLAHKIPEILFIDPINRFLDLIANGDTKSNEISKELPIELEKLEAKILELLHQAQEHERNKAAIQLGHLTAQVAHDIRSPLSALNTSMKLLPQIPEDLRILMRNAVDRINDIANNLLQQYKGTLVEAKSTRKIWLLAPLVESMLSEKRLTLEGRPVSLEAEITSEGFAAFAEFDAHEMKRLLSNLINNALEAFGPNVQGKITVLLDAKESQIHLAVIDNGMGIPAEHLASVLQPGVTLKETGNGLGLPHAKKTVEDWGGKFNLTSTEGKGTEVSLDLRRANAPSWFVSDIKVSENTVIGILDDDQSVHNAWDQRLLAVSKNLKINHFRNSQDFIAWYKSQSGEVQVFSDYELLGDSLTGLEVLEQLGLGKNALLVTSHYEKPEIMERCQQRQIRLLPKNLLAHVPIELITDHTQGHKTIDLILIDDNPQLRKSWELAAEFGDKLILTFGSPDEFEQQLADIDCATPIYIDSDLGYSMKGEEYAQILFEKKRFKEIYLVTGHPADSFKAMPWIRAIQDKNPPF